MTEEPRRYNVAWQDVERIARRLCAILEVGPHGWGRHEDEGVIERTWNRQTDEAKAHYRDLAHWLLAPMPHRPEFDTPEGGPPDG